MSYGRILVVDADEYTCKLLRPCLEFARYKVRCCTTGELALDELRRHPPDLIVLGLRGPGVDGLQVCRLLRAASDLPIILVTARAKGQDMLDGFRSGADDCLAKPFSALEVAARVKAILRRTRHVGGGAAAPGRLAAPMEAAGVRIDPVTHEVQAQGQTVEMTPTEFRLLETLARQPGRAFTRAQCIERAFKTDFDGLDRNVDMHIMNLRKKLGIEPSPICTVQGVGYALASPMA